VQHYPRSKDKMFPLPKKLLFGSLDSETIDQRTKDIEEYMATIITNIPAVCATHFSYMKTYYQLDDWIMWSYL
jgi:hypothetical protein